MEVNGCAELRSVEPSSTNPGIVFFFLSSTLLGSVFHQGRWVILPGGTRLLVDPIPLKSFVFVLPPVAFST